jgi:hypothetical protein
MLKGYVAEHPGVIGLQSAGQPELEYLFISGDRCDVVFDLGQDGQAVVEVKNGERGELIRGIYQAVKYRALMQAECGHGEPSPVVAYLVAYDQIPQEILVLADKLDIHCYAVSRSQVLPQ